MSTKKIIMQYQKIKQLYKIFYQLTIKEWQAMTKKSKEPVIPPQYPKKAPKIPPQYPKKALWQPHPELHDLVLAIYINKTFLLRQVSAQKHVFLQMK